MNLRLLLTALSFFATAAIAQGPNPPNFEEMSLEELSKLPEDIIKKMPARLLFAKMADESEDFSASPEMITLLLSLPLRELFYLAPPMQHNERDYLSAVRDFQSDIGVEQTGELTIGQYSELSRMFTRRRDTPIYASTPMSVYVIDGYATAQGTWIIEGEDIAYPVNTAKVECSQRSMDCTMVQAEVAVPSLDSDQTSYGLTLTTIRYEVISWKEDEVVARGIGGLGPQCRTTLLTLNSSTEEVYEIARNAASEGCGVQDSPFSLPPLESPRISRMVDGWDVTYEYWQQRKRKTSEYLNSRIRDEAFLHALGITKE